MFPEQKPVLYVWVRKLPSMNHGKALAHSGHAASQMAYVCGGNEMYNKWVSSGPGFGTQINLDHGDVWPEDVFDKIQEIAGYSTGYVTDPTYPFLVDAEIVDYLNPDLVIRVKFVGDKMLCTRSQETAFWAFVDANDPEIKTIIEQFALAP